MAILTWLGVPGEPERWRRLAFEVHDASLVVGSVLHDLGRDPAWGFDNIGSEASALGVETREVTSPGSRGPHPNGIDRIDHIVYSVPDLDAAVAALERTLGAPPRRRAFPRGPGGPEMAFFTVGGCFIEVVASGRSASLWGIAFSTPDLDACVAAVRAAGGPIGDPKPAVQGGRIASVWKEHVGWGVAVMEPPAR